MDFIVVGGIAVSIQGYVRLTENVDLLIGWKSKSVREKDQFDALALRR